MANITKTTKKAGMKAAAPVKAGDAVPDYLLQDNQDGSFDIFGVNQAGNQVDISGVATLDAQSSDTATLTVDPPSGMHVACHGAKPGNATATVTATWNDGSTGPFTIEVPCSISSSPVTGLSVTLGTPTIRG